MQIKVLSVWRLAAVLALGASFLTADSVSAQARPRIGLPPVWGGTPLSHQINAEAAYLVARGDLIESVAIARRINAEAVALEIENSVAYVDAYFRRRELNRQWQAKEDPNYLEQEKHRQEVRRQRLEQQFQDVLKGDVTAELNWLLTELSGPMLAYQYLSPQTKIVDTELDPKLAPQDVALVRFSNGSSEQSGVVFSAADAAVLDMPWPLALRPESFSTLRKQYETARDVVLQQIRAGGSPTPEAGEKLVQSINTLLVALEDVYPREKRSEPAVFLQYFTAKRYLTSSAAQACSVIQSGGTWIADGSLRFRGDSLLDLLQHMDRNGLIFAPPAPGGERVYRSLAGDLRNLWVIWSKDQ